ncbi:hypothetical protein BV898_15160 [Hypsibius exemplaris]|uniref:Uncharacterized protein n=1 Tax=Hypsibius exemplaris TaxID=2072580 RepID=A0A9X6NAX9_HYPEX|nr:hypothetical protein BV898_15160 [Hypsibius exemplaris]
MDGSNHLRLALFCSAMLWASAVAAASYTVRTETQTWNSSTKRSKVEINIVVQDSTAGNEDYAKNPSSRDATTDSFPFLGDSRSTEDLVKAALQQFTREFTRSNRDFSTQSPESSRAARSSKGGSRKRKEPTTTSTETPTGEIGEDLTIATHCLFFTNCSYSCRTGCHSDRPKMQRTIPGSPKRHYSEYVCDREVTMNPQARWSEADGIIGKYFDTSRVNEVVASCAFYAAHWYECAGVADCSAGQQGFLTCAGAAPWKGYYEGSPAEGSGWRGNITIEAMNSPESGSRRKNGLTGISRTCK